MIEKELDEILEKVYNLEMNPYTAKKRILQLFDKYLKKENNNITLELSEGIKYGTE